MDGRLAAIAVVAWGVTRGGRAVARPPPPSRPSSTTAGRPGPGGKRYCEVLLVRLTPSGLVATVYNTFPLNGCPEVQWAALDVKAIAAANGVPFAELNGPRYWLMDTIDKERSGAEVVKTFGGIAMIEEATVVLGASVAAAEIPYTPHAVSRQASFTFAAGRQVYELVAPDGTVWVMQTYSQIKDPTLVHGRPSRSGVPTDATDRVDVPCASSDPAARRGDRGYPAQVAAGRPGGRLLGGDRRITERSGPACPPVRLAGHRPSHRTATLMAAVLWSVAG